VRTPGDSGYVSCNPLLRRDGPSRRRTFTADDMNLHAPPFLRCPACRRIVSFDFVEIVGELALLNCPHCSGVRVDQALEQVLARN